MRETIACMKQLEYVLLLHKKMQEIFLCYGKNQLKLCHKSCP